MLLCAAGDTHGALDRLYRDVLAFEADLGARFDQVLHVGDLGVWPDATHIDKATRNHEGAGDFPAWYTDQRGVPRPTVFIKGNHEDFDWLAERRRQRELEVLPGLTYLPSGEVLDVEVDGARCRVGGIGGCHGPANYVRRASNLQGRAQRHFTHDEVEALASRGRVDILLLHDAPASVEFTWRRRDGSVRRRYASEAQGLADVVAATRPLVCLFGHHHTRLDATVAGVSCIGLNKAPFPGSLVALEVEPRARQFRVMGEWPPAPNSGRGDHSGCARHDERRLMALAQRVSALNERARELGLFTDDRELLTCPRCGLMEDVLIDGRLVTWRGVGGGQDTGLRFVEVEDGSCKYVCPQCRTVIRLEGEELVAGEASP